MEYQRLNNKKCVTDALREKSKMLKKNDIINHKTQQINSKSREIKIQNTSYKKM